MSEKVTKLLQDKGGNYLLPFFWQHGETEEVLRKYMEVIRNANIGAVCVESRPHPDFAGPQWWHDMDIILDEARRRGMKVWILDDSHFPTGFANGAVDNYPDDFCRQSVLHTKAAVAAGETFTLTAEQAAKAPERVKTQIEAYTAEKDPRVFDDDVLLDVYAVYGDGSIAPLKERLTAGGLSWTADADAAVYCIYLSRNYGYHTHYINMTSAKSVRVLIDAVYEPHWEHYKDDFGTTIAGFFSDEPELGNGHMYDLINYIGNPEADYPWSEEIAAGLTERWGADYAKKLYLLFEEGDADAVAEARFGYMDVLTELVKKNFSFQLGDWCRSHGVDYIGHLIEDNDQHEHTGSSLGHYFRGLAGQSWAGIDDIGGQVYPQGENITFNNGVFQARNGEFYHFMMGHMASSAAAIEPLKKGNSMCEIFGAYGWGEGVREMKYLVDHFMVRGVNHFVPHAFSPKDFPDSDCPPHFYAHGHNPQYRAFGALMKYTNRVLELINDGCHIAPVAILYSAEGKWTGGENAMEDHAVSRPLTENQIEFDFIPSDVFADPEAFGMKIEDKQFAVNTQHYKALVIPETPYIRRDVALAIPKLAEAGVEVYFISCPPSGIMDAKEGDDVASMLEAVKEEAFIVDLEDLVGVLWEQDVQEIVIQPEDDFVRYYHYEHADGSALYMFVNEGTLPYKGEIKLADSRRACWYDAWNNEVHAADYDGERLSVTLEPWQSSLLILDAELPVLSPSFEEKKTGTAALAFGGAWKRSLSNSVDYPAFGEPKEVTLPDNTADDDPIWSGFARYENTFEGKAGGTYLLEISDASEGVEVFVNGQSLGIQDVPTYRFDLSAAVKDGTNDIAVEVATTLEREMSTVPNPMAMLIGKTVPEVTTPSGLNGEVTLFVK